MFPSVGILGNIFVRNISSHESCTFLIRKNNVSFAGNMREIMKHCQQSFCYQSVCEFVGKRFCFMEHLLFCNIVREAFIGNIIFF